MSSFSITKFKNELNRAGGFSRGYLFKCNVVTPNTRLLQEYPGARNRLLLCQSAKLPGFVLNNTKLHYMTKEVSIPGARINQPFTATFYSTNDYNAYGFFTKWQKLINTPRSNRKGVVEYVAGNSQVVEDNPQNLYSDIIFDHFSPESSAPAFLESTPIVGLFIFGDNIPVARYRLERAYPSSISGLDFSFDGDTTVQSFSVEFNYQNMDYITPKDLKNETLNTLMQTNFLIG